VVSVTNPYGRNLGFLDRNIEVIELHFVSYGAHGSVMVKALCYKLEGHGFDT
jgi:hypothetical protein